MSRLAPAILLLFAAPALAQTPGTCQLGTAEADLNIGDVRARVFNTGALFFGQGTTDGTGYLVPKDTGRSPLYAQGLWIGGTVGGDLRVAGATYGDFEFWPGPLGLGAALPNPDDCSPYDRIWLVDVFDVQQYDETGDATADLAEWPLALGAPVVDGDGVEGNYDLAAGDRPEIYGHQTAFWVMNDVGNEHERYGTEPIGLEVRVTAFASAEPELAQQSFYRYELVNRNSLPFEDARFGFFVDPDLGDAADDYVGSDSTRHLAFAYNATNADDIYGTPPPAVGHDFLSGGATAMNYEGPPGCVPTADPCTATDMYNRLSGLWNDGTPMTEGGNGYQTDGPVVEWVFPGDPASEQFWSGLNVDGEGSDYLAGDRQYSISGPAFSLAPGESQVFDFAVLFATGMDHLDSVTALKGLSDAVQARYDEGMLFAPSEVPVAAEDGAAALTTARLDAVYPNPVRDRATVAFAVAEPGPVRLTVHDVLGRRVRTLAEGPLAAGEHSATFDAAGLRSGIYLMVLEAGGQRATRKVMIVR